MASHRLTGLDSVFLSAESPGKALHMMAILVLDPGTIPGGYSFERFREFFRERLHLVPPLHRRLAQAPLGLARPIWKDDPDLDITRHLRRAAVPEPGGPAELAALAAEIEERPLDRNRPMWEIVVVEGVQGGRIAVLAKIHHAMMDGMAGVKFMASLFSREPDTPSPTCQPVPVAASSPGALELLTGAVPSLLTRPVWIARAAVSTLGFAIRRLVSDGSQHSDLEPVNVELSWLNASVSDRRSIAYTSVPMDRVREVGSALSATLNDVILALVAGALRRETRRRGELGGPQLVAGVPVSLHEDGDDAANAYSVAYVELATQLADPLDRLRAIRDSAQRAKRRQRNVFGDSLAIWADLILPIEAALIARAYSAFDLWRRMSPLCNLVVSNVPGPPVPLYLGGARLVGIHPLGPIFDGATLNITVLSRENDLDFGIVACGERIPDPWPLARGIEQALDELCDALEETPAQRSGERPRLA